MSDAFWRYVRAALAAGALLVGVGRYVGNMEQRIEQLERSQQYLHGTFAVPQGRGE